MQPIAGIMTSRTIVCRFLSVAMLCFSGFAWRDSLTLCMVAYASDANKIEGTGATKTKASDDKKDAAKDFGEQLLLKMSEPAKKHDKSHKVVPPPAEKSSKDKAMAESRREALEKAQLLTTMEHRKITWKILEQCLSDDVLSGDLDLSASSVTNTGMYYVGKQPRLRSLNLSAVTAISNEGLRELRGLTNLRSLNLSGTNISDDGVHYLQDMKQLDFLKLSYLHGLFGPGLRYLVALPKLQKLFLYNSAISGDCLSPLKTLPLEELELYGTHVGDDTISGLQGFSHLKHLDAGSDRITDSSADVISTLSTLERLDLRAKNITDRSTSALSELSNLRRLDIGSTKITVKGLETLTKLQNIEWLSTEGCDLHDEAISTLIKFPHLTKLCLSKSSLTAKGLDEISKLHLIELWFADADRSCVDSLTKLKGLKFLHLRNADWLRSDQEKLVHALSNCKIDVW